MYLILIIIPEMLNLDSLTLADLIGVPYKDHGRDLDGLDCYGCGILAEYILVRKKLKDALYDKNIPELEQQLVPTLNVEKTDVIERGNILEMTLFNELHIGVVIDSKTFIHATRNQGVRISNINAWNIQSIYKVIDDGNN